jgi:hypothetical protein
VRRLTAILLFLALANDRSTAAIYDQYMFAPFGWVQAVLFEPIAAVRPFDLLIIVMLIIASAKGGGKGPRVRSMRTVLLAEVVVVAAWLAYGAANGGDFKSGCWQVYLMITSVILAFELAANFHTVEQFAVLGKVVVWAALYHAAVCWWFYEGAFKAIYPVPEYVTCHDDTVLWVVGILILIANAIEKHNRKTSLQALAAVSFIIVAIQFNNRRLAWVSLAMALIEGFVLLPKGPAKRRVVRTVVMLVPVLLIYGVVGWGRTEKMFAPLKSLQTVSVEEDASTKARNMENLGLIATGNASSMLVGTGWGHGYIEVSNKYAIYGFELWRFVPHNSILGLLAFSGAFGFIGFWLPFPTAMFLNARVARLGNTPASRTMGLVAAAQMLVCANQMYGDMGDFSYRTMYVLAGSYALAMRLPPLAGVWTEPGRAKRAKAVAA